MRKLGWVVGCPDTYALGHIVPDSGTTDRGAHLSNEFAAALVESLRRQRSTQEGIVELDLDGLVLPGSCRASRRYGQRAVGSVRG